MWITAAVLAEICSALPLSGSIYIWATEAAGSNPGFARFIGFIVAWWSSTAWMTFAAGNCQNIANHLLSLLVVWEVDFPGGIGYDNVKWRALIWGVSEALFFLAIALNYLPPRLYSLLFRFAIFLMMLDFLLCLIWFPIGVARTYGFRSAKEAFITRYNGTGAPEGWNWLLSFLFTAGTLTGFDASGHIAEETKNARLVLGNMDCGEIPDSSFSNSVVAARGILTSAFATGVFGFATAILFLFATPPIDVWYTLTAPQPFVQIYALAIGRGGATFMTILAVIGLIVNTSIAIVAASRLIFAIARDGVLPGSRWIGQVTADGQPRHAVTIMLVFGATLLCVILPSQVAFTSLISAGGIPTIAAYGLIALLRLTMTPNAFKNSKFYLGKWRRVFYAAAVFFNALVFAVYISPFSFPVTAQTFNFACVIFGSVTIFAILCWLFMPEEKWLRREHIRKMAVVDGALPESQDDSKGDAASDDDKKHAKDGTAISTEKE
jgi:translation initiation factor 5B